MSKEIGGYLSVRDNFEKVTMTTSFGCMVIAFLLTVGSISILMADGFSWFYFIVSCYGLLLIAGEYFPQLESVFESKLANVIVLVHRLMWLAFAILVMLSIWFTDEPVQYFWINTVIIVFILIVRIPSLIIFSLILFVPRFQKNMRRMYKKSTLAPDV